MWHSHFYRDFSLLFIYNNRQICVRLCHLSGSYADSYCLGISCISLPPLASVDYRLPLDVQSTGFSLKSPFLLNDSSRAASRIWRGRGLNSENVEDEGGVRRIDTARAWVSDMAKEFDLSRLHCSPKRTRRKNRVKRVRKHMLGCNN